LNSDSWCLGLFRHISQRLKPGFYFGVLAMVLCSMALRANRLSLGLVVISQFEVLAQVDPSHLFIF